ncbi:dihydroorotate dehydrogenase electron transfer subunit [Acidihalobacter prosperus]|uniref:Dihydroorotate dehydrogenase electron transfer subunit n=1 Tax=Acidihalobacter prosperus TaxID=160660 RepID=A0A1A6C0Q2_9GAMM|nr:dihydroorotate dehydrogenase electron transfer subunit [Acidihalobacter prosperus]OBS08141.1 dihydroorotate dehydrogenase electron transfer subunit [Acidihalobacter prosperus]
MNAKPHRNTIFVEDATVLSHQAHDAGQYILRVQAPRCAAHAEPGSFVHLSCDPMLPLRRPLSIMRVDPEAGWVEFLYKAVGYGTGLLARRAKGDTISLMGPIGRPFAPHPQRRRPLLIGGGVGIPPMVFLADRLRRQPDYSPFAILGSEVPFPFRAKPSQIMLSGVPEGVIAAMPLLEDWGIPSRLASLRGYAGCHEGYVTDLARHWLDGLSAEARAEVEIFACGPHPMLAAVASLARDFDLPAQVSLEEYMACAVGGCAGCTVRVNTPEGPAMKRVCVDGPVFDAAMVAFGH